MTRRVAALLITLAVIGGACGATAPSGPDASARPAATPAAPGPTKPPRTAAPTPATILAVAAADRPSGPWAVTFSSAGTTAIREVYLLTAACAEPTCDLSAIVQTWTGLRIGTATFTYADGMYRFETDTREVIDCETPVETISGGATQTIHTNLLIAGYRPAGIAAISVDIRGTRTITVTPTSDNGCAAGTTDYIANGDRTELAAAPTPTPHPPTAIPVPGISKTFFGSAVTVDSYPVSGTTPGAIIVSIRAHGPYSDWAKERAEAVTVAVPRYRFELVGAGAQCRIHVTARPAITFAYTVTLPRWNQPTGASRSTITWWSDEIQSVARHERHHIELWRAGATRLTDAVATSSCANVNDRLATIARAISRQQCEFDLKEYGAAMGLTLETCLAR